MDCFDGIIEAVFHPSLNGFGLKTEQSGRQ